MVRYSLEEFGLCGTPVDMAEEILEPEVLVIGGRLGGLGADQMPIYSKDFVLRAHQHTIYRTPPF